MSRYSDGPRSLSETMRQLAMRYRRVDLSAIQVVRERWSSIVSAPLAQYAEPTEVRDGVLVVAVPNGAFAERVAMEESRIVSALSDMGATAPTSVRATVR